MNEITLQPTTIELVEANGVTLETQNQVIELLSSDPTVLLQIIEGELTWSGGEPDKHYTQNFTASAEITVNHGLGKRPAVTIIDSAGDEVIGDVRHNSVNQLTVTLTSSTSGKIICN